MKTYDLYWSPEGRKIDTVEAPSARAAIRKASKPYKQYLGEIYAVCINPNKFTAVVTLHTPGYLLGGTRKHESIAFTSRFDAQSWGEQAVSVNKNRPGFENADIRLTIAEE